VIDLSRREGRPLKIGHRGAAALAPENTLESFRVAVAHTVDLVEFDVLDLLDGPLVIAHSDHLDEVSHGAAQGRVRQRTLEQLREVAPELPTLEEGLQFFVEEAPEVGLHIDLKLATRVDELVTAVLRHDLAPRTVVSSFNAVALRVVASAAPTIRIGFTYPEDRFSVSRRRYLWPAVRVGLSTLRASVPRRIPRMLTRAGASALMLQHALVTPAAVARAHAHDAVVFAWTVDDPADLERVVACGVDGVVTNDPRIFVATLRA
jgi:glycerophosphoryl diester phosphodiesterase